jgi:hypothetical protein
MLGVVVPFTLDNSLLAFHRHTLAGSITGGVPEPRVRHRYVIDVERSLPA